MTNPFQPHPVVEAPSVEAQVEILRARGPEEAARIFAEIERRRQELIAAMDADRFRNGYVPEVWRKARAEVERRTLTAIFGGNGASKTVFSAWLAANRLVDHAGSKVLFIHESEQSSINVHQAFVFDYLPPEWRPAEGKKIRRTLTTKVNYSRADGFSGNKFVLPNGSMAQFAFYGQDVADYEGGGWHLVVADENLPLGWLRTLMYRLPRVGGKFVWTYSPIRGITPAIRHVVAGARTLESRRAELLPENHRADESQDWPAGHMPFIQESVLPDTGIVYFFSEDNPWSGYEDLKKVLSMGGSTLEIERRAYGYARNTTRATFPLFGRAHVVPAAKMPAENCTRYHVCDPAGRRNMFQIWVAVDEQGRYFVYREWPDRARHGEWAVPAEESRRWDGDPGPAQPSLGYGVVDYKRQILEAEGNRWDDKAGAWAMDGETIFERLIDPRSGAAASISEDTGASSLIDRFGQEQADAKGRIVGPPLEFAAAAGLREEEGLQAINDLLAYDNAQPVTAGLNEPRLFVSEACENLIWCMQNYTGHDGEKAASKDPIDCLRYAATADLDHVSPETLKTLAGGAY